MVLAAAPVTERRETSLLKGISSSFRTNPYTGAHLEVDRAEGPYLHTTDGRTYIDFFMAHGSEILGHAPAPLFEAIRHALIRHGVVSGYETGMGEEVAARLARMVPSAEKVRFAASGSEAVYMSIRLARAVTGRDLVIKIDGHFNGGADYALFNSLARQTDESNPGGRASRLVPISAGIPSSVRDSILPVPWNDLPALRAALEDHRGQVAAVIMVPIDFNNGCLTPAEGYLAAARDMTHDAGAILIFDEVLSGFKTGTSCAQGYYGVTPDITTLSKALSNGVPLSAIVGRADLLERFTLPIPQGALQGGTFAGNLIGVSAARTTLDALERPDFYPALLDLTCYFLGNLQGVFDRSPTPARVQWEGNMFGIYVGTREPVHTYADIRRLDPEMAGTFFSRVIDRGLYFHTDFMISAAHSREVLDEALSRLESVAAMGV
jgi:glutamate-1-semialdehyde 2,1-aminomutase